MRKYSKRLYSLFGLLLLLGLAGLAAAPAPATAAGSGVTSAITQSYNADPSVVTSMLVELKPKDPSTVVPLASADIHNMLGVVVPTSDAPIVLTPPSGSAQQVLVAGSGRYNLLVSNQNGPIEAGDYLSISAVAGIAMKAGATQTESIGRAIGSFDGSSNVIGKVPLKGSLGGTTSASIGDIPANIQLASNPLFHTNNSLPSYLARAANTVASKQVSPVRVYLSVVVLIATLAIVCSMFYSSVRGGMIAVGRNPLAKKAIGRGLVQDIIAGLIIFVAGILGVYLILNF